MHIYNEYNCHNNSNSASVTRCFIMYNCLFQTLLRLSIFYLQSICQLYNKNSVEEL